MADDHPTSPDAMQQEGAASGARNRLRQVILPTCARNVVGTTVGIARGVKTEIATVDHVDEETRGKFEGDLLRGTYIPDAYPRTGGDTRALGVAGDSGLEEGDIERRIRVIFSRAVAPRAERITEINGAVVPQDGVKINDANGMSQVIKEQVGDFEIPVDELLWLVGHDERRQRREDVVSDTAYLIRQLGMHAPQYCENKRRIVEVRDTALRYVIKCCQVLMQQADEAPRFACHGRVRQAFYDMAGKPGIEAPAPTARITDKWPPVLRQH